MVKATADHTLYAHWAVPAKAPTIDNITEDQTIVYGKGPHFSLGYGSTIAYKVSEKWYECDQNGNNARLLTDEVGEPVFEPVRPTVGVHYYHVELTATRIANGLTASVKSQVVKVTVEKTTPTITTKPKAAAIDLADSRTLRGSALTGGVAKNNNSSPRLDVDGTFTWADGAIKPAVGYQSYTVLFTPNDKDNYNTAECEVSLTVKCSHIWDDGTVTTPPACTVEGGRPSPALRAAPRRRNPFPPRRQRRASLWITITLTSGRQMKRITGTPARAAWPPKARRWVMTGATGRSPHRPQKAPGARRHGSADMTLLTPRHASFRRSRLRRSPPGTTLPAARRIPGMPPMTPAER